MIQVKENLTPEQIRQFSETAEIREFGLFDKARRAVRRGVDNAISKRINRDSKFKAGVIVLKASLKNKSITYTLGDRSVTGDTPKDAEAKLEKLINDIWESNPEGQLERPEEGEGLVYQYPVIKMKAVPEGNYKTEIQEEMGDAMKSNDWLRLAQPKIKTLKGKVKL